MIEEVLNTELPVALAVAILAIIILAGLLCEAGYSRRCQMCDRRWAIWIRTHPGLTEAIQVCRKCREAIDRRGRSIIRTPSR